MWKNININKSNIELQTSKATLIKMPNNSEYKGYMFWHPTKLIRSGRHSNAVSIGYTDDFKFKIFKNGNGKWNKYDKISEKEISVSEFLEAFEVIDSNITSQKSDYETHKPTPLEAKEVSILDELKDE